jgi:hypothetical protein
MTPRQPIAAWVVGLSRSWTGLSLAWSCPHQRRTSPTVPPLPRRLHA